MAPGVAATASRAAPPEPDDWPFSAAESAMRRRSDALGSAEGAPVDEPADPPPSARAMSAAVAARVRLETSSSPERDGVCERDAVPAPRRTDAGIDAAAPRRGVGSTKREEDAPKPAERIVGI